MVATATALDGHVFFGQSGVAQLTTETNPAYLTLSQTMPGDPQLLRDAYQPPQGANSAQNTQTSATAAATSAMGEVRRL